MRISSLLCAISSTLHLLSTSARVHRIPEGSPRTNAFTTAKREEEKGVVSKPVGSDANVTDENGGKSLLAEDRNKVP